jgi:hypothetical protein
MINFNFRKNKNFFTLLFISLSVIFILITYSAVKQQQSTRSRAAGAGPGRCVDRIYTPTPTPTTAPSTCSGLTQTQCNATENATNCRWLKDRAECVQECNKYTIQTCDLTYCVVNTNFCRVQCRYLYSNTICANQTGRCEWCTASNSCINAGGSCGITNTPTPTRTPTPTPIGPTNTPTPTPSGTTSIDLELKLSFQGITADFPPEALTNDTLNVKVSIIDDTQNYIPVNNETVTVYADESRIWTGQITITNIPLAELNQNKFYMLIKGPKHIQKKICDSAPAEGESGYYSCQFGNIAFQQGLNTFDFTGIRLLAGDLPINGTQDGNINAEDVAMIYNNFLSTDPSVLAVADLDLNGIIEMHDWSLMIESLEVKYDEK